MFENPFQSVAFYARVMCAVSNGEVGCDTELISRCSVDALKRAIRHSEYYQLGAGCDGETQRKNLAVCGSLRGAILKR